MKTFILLAIPLTLAGCAPAMPGDSLGDSARPPMVPYVPDFGHAPTAELPMLSDPEAESETWTDYVWADDEAEAERECKRLAQTATAQGGSEVTYVGVKRTSQRGKKWECTFSSSNEGETDGSF